MRNSFATGPQIIRLKRDREKNTFLEFYNCHFEALIRDLHQLVLYSSQVAFFAETNQRKVAIRLWQETEREREMQNLSLALSLDQMYKKQLAKNKNKLPTNNTRQSHRRSSIKKLKMQRVVRTKCMDLVADICLARIELAFDLNFGFFFVFHLSKFLRFECKFDSSNLQMTSEINKPLTC